MINIMLLNLFVKATGWGKNYYTNAVIYFLFKSCKQNDEIWPWRIKYLTRIASIILNRK